MRVVKFDPAQKTWVQVHSLWRHLYRQSPSGVLRAIEDRQSRSQALVLFEDAIAHYVYLKCRRQLLST